MQMRGHVGAFLLAFLQRTFGAQIADQRHDPRHNRKNHAYQQRESRQNERHGGMLDSQTGRQHGTYVHRVAGENYRDSADHRPELAVFGVIPQPGNPHAGRADQQRKDERGIDAGGEHQAGGCEQYDAGHRQKRRFRCGFEHVPQTLAIGV